MDKISCEMGRWPLGFTEKNILICGSTRIEHEIISNLLWQRHQLLPWGRFVACIGTRTRMLDSKSMYKEVSNHIYIWIASACEHYLYAYTILGLDDGLSKVFLGCIRKLTTWEINRGCWFVGWQAKKVVAG